MALKCAQCGTENPDDAYFCSKCGAQVWSAFNKPAGPTSIGGELPGDSGATAPLSPATPNRIAPPPPSPEGESGFLIDKPSVPATPPPPPSSAYAPQDYSQFQAPVAAAPPVAGYGFAPPPPDGNTSGMGTAYPPPPQTQGWNFGGCVPWGLFGFFNGSTLWGVLGLVAHFTGLSLVYAIYIGIKGKELAWQNRRFDSMMQFEDTMKAWNRWGIIVTVIEVVLLFLYIVFVFGLAMWAATQPSTTVAPTSPPASSSSVSIQ